MYQGLKVCIPGARIHEPLGLIEPAGLIEPVAPIQPVAPIH
jgi:hypothetical protein